MFASGSIGVWYLICHKGPHSRARGESLRDTVAGRLLAHLDRSPSETDTIQLVMYTLLGTNITHPKNYFWRWLSELPKVEYVSSLGGTCIYFPSYWFSIMVNLLGHQHQSTSSPLTEFPKVSRPQAISLQTGASCHIKTSWIMGEFL